MSKRANKGGWSITSLLGLATALIITIVFVYQKTKEWLTNTFPNAGKTVEKATEWNASVFLGHMDWMIQYVGIAVTTAILIMLYYRIYARWNARCVQIIPHRNTTASAEKIDQFMKDLYKRYRVWYKQLYKGKEWFRFLIYHDEAEEKIKFYLIYPQDKSDGVKATLADHFSNAELVDIPHRKVPLPKGWKGSGGNFFVNQHGTRSALPLKSFDKSQLASILYHMKPGTWVDVRFTPHKGRRLQDRVKTAMKNLNLTEEELMGIFQLQTDHPRKKLSELSPEENARYRSLYSQFTGREKPFEVSLAIWAGVKRKEKRRKQIRITRIRRQIKKMITGRYWAKRIERIVSRIQSRIQEMKQRQYWVGWIQTVQQWRSDKRRHVAAAQDLKAQIEKTMEFDNYIYMTRIRVGKWLRNPVQRLSPVPLFQPRMIWTHSELANLIHLPPGPSKEQIERRDPHIYDRVVHLIPGQKRIQDDLKSGMMTVGYVHHPIQNDLVYLALDVVKQMGSTVGDIGSGKTALFLLLSHTWMKWCYQNPGMGGMTVFFDKKGTAGYNMLTRILRDEMIGYEVNRDRLHYIDFSSTEFTLGLNLLHRHPWQSVDDVVENALTVLQHAYDVDDSSGSIRLEKYGRLALRALMLDEKQQHTILALSEFIAKDSPLRERIVKQFQQSDDVVKRKLAKDILAENFGTGETESIRNRLIKLLDDTIIRRIFGQRENQLKVLEWLDEGHVVLFNLRGLKSNAQTALIMGYITSQYWQIALHHRKFPNKLHPFLCDEAHLIQLPVMADMIEVLRERGLPLFLFTQHYKQYRTDIYDALGLVGTKIAFRQQDRTHATKAAEKMGGQFDPRDIQNLEPLHAVATINGEPMLIKTDPPVIYGPDGSPTYYGPDVERRDREQNQAFEWAMEKLGRPLMERDCRPVEEVDQEIQEYLEAILGEGEKRKNKFKLANFPVKQANKQVSEEQTQKTEKQDRKKDREDQKQRRVPVFNVPNLVKRGRNDSDHRLDQRSDDDDQG